MNIKTVIVFPSDGDESFELELTKIRSRGSASEYMFQNDDTYKAFQFDSHNDRPGDYKEEFVEDKSFFGYLINRKKKGDDGPKWIECNIKVKY